MNIPVPLVIVNIFFLSPGFCTQDAISCTKQPHSIAWYTRGRSLFLYQPPITASLVRPKSFPYTKATLRCHLSTENHAWPEKELLVRMVVSNSIHKVFVSLPKVKNEMRAFRCHK